jgi:uncharacterized membrane protein
MSRLRSQAGPLLALVLAVAVNALVLAGITVPFARPAAAFWFAVICPAYLLFTTSAWPASRPGERAGYSVCGALLILMAAGLVLNTVLPAVGLHRPLDTIPVLVTVDLINALLYLLRRRWPAPVNGPASVSGPAPVSWRAVLAGTRPEEARLLTLAAVSVALVVLGANRLNNGAGDELTIVALAVITATVALQFRWARLIREGVTCLVVYLVALGLLLSTSLRGWYVTGHDIQQEYHVFQLTAAHGHWDMAYFRNAYNACLSITILPTELSRLVDVDSPYVYKVFFQLIFALCPVLALALARRYWSRPVAVLAVTYLIGFPTFFTDMPFLNRQEVAFLFVSAGILAATNPAWSPRRRRLVLLVAAAGTELSHYSTMYVFLGTVTAAWVARDAAILLARFRRQALTTARAARTITLGVIAVMAVLTALWGGVATRTTGPLLAAANSAATGGQRSQDVSFSLLGGHTDPLSVVLQNYHQSTLAGRAGPASGLYLPASALAGASTPIVSPAERPLTAAGRALAAVGVPVVMLNALLRTVTAYLEQLFLAVGLVRLFLLGRRRRRTGPEVFWLSAGSVVMVGLFTALPAVSAEYGVLRSFQEALIVVAPVVVAGSLTAFRPAGRRRARAAAAAVCLGLFVTTTGLLPQLLGGNRAELNLNDSGLYYDAYYTLPQEQAAVGWLAAQPGGRTAPIQAGFIEDRWDFTSPADVTGSQVITDIYPTVVLRDSWLILGYPTTSTGLAYTLYDGDLIGYRYPTQVLTGIKNLVYDNQDTEIYK